MAAAGTAYVFILAALQPNFILEAPSTSVMPPLRDPAFVPWFSRLPDSMKTCAQSMMGRRRPEEGERGGMLRSARFHSRSIRLLPLSHSRTMLFQEIEPLYPTSTAAAALFVHALSEHLPARSLGGLRDERTDSGGRNQTRRRRFDERTDGRSNGKLDTNSAKWAPNMESNSSAGK